jgi:hypothetical protein
MEFTSPLEVMVIISEGENAPIFYELATTKLATTVTFVGE